MEDNYENRALFLVMFYGAPSHLLIEKFPKWYHERTKFKYGSVEEALWLANFAREAYEQKEK